MKHEPRCFEKNPDCICLKCKNDGVVIANSVCCNDFSRVCGIGNYCPGFEAEGSSDEQDYKRQ